MIKLIRSIFGLCHNRWLHDWNNGSIQEGTIRVCLACNMRQRCLGFNTCLAGDGDIVPVWETLPK